MVLIGARMETSRIIVLFSTTTIKVKNLLEKTNVHKQHKQRVYRWDKVALTLN